MIEFKEVSKKYGKISALYRVNLRIPQGEIFTVMGPNGSGKSTMLRIMSGIERPSTGEIYYKDQRVKEETLSELRKNSTLVFQKTVLFNTTVEKNMAYGLKLRNYSTRKIEVMVKEALKTVKMQGYEKRWAKTLSGGEQQRVSLARALVLNTDLLLLDEPTANLDPKNISIVEETISRINREQGTTIVIATHNIFQAESLTNKAALIIGGKVAQTGTTHKIFRTPSKSLASFARLENVFTGNSETLEQGNSLIHIDNEVSIEAAARLEGTVTFLVRPQDIILSKRKIVSSARNVLKGKVTGIRDMENTVKLTVEAGKDFIVQITKQSFNEMQLNIGSTVFITFKASSVHII